MRGMVSSLRPLALCFLVACGGSAPLRSRGSQLGGANDMNRDPDLRDEKLNGRHTQYPIVLHHGFNASPDNEWGFYKVKEALEADGHVVYVSWVRPFGSVADRTTDLAEIVYDALVDQWHPWDDPAPLDLKVNIIAHSMGGLDSRELISVLGYGDAVASLTTISTPHHGSAVADFALSVLPDHADKALNALGKAFATTFTRADLAADSDVRAALTSLAESSAADFNATHPDDPRVFYQSWAGISSVGGITIPGMYDACGGTAPSASADKMNAQLVPMAAFVSHFADRGELLANDGMATVESAKWGTFRGCIPADHLDEVGQIKYNGTDPRTGFDHIRFYRNMAFDLAAAGY